MHRITQVLVTACIIASFCLAQNAPVSDANGLPVLADGTPVKLRVTRSVSSADARVGEEVEFEVVDEVHVGNIVVIQKGNAASAKITVAQAKKAGDHSGKLELAVEFVRLGDGNKAALRAVESGSDENPAVLNLGPRTLSGKDIKLANGSEVTAYVSGNVVIDPRRFAQLGGAIAKIPEEVLAKETTELQISSQPVTAEVTVDNQLVGDTPVRVLVHNGDHVVTVRVSGYTGWFQTVHAGGGVMPIRVALETGLNNQVQYKDELSSQTGTCAWGVCGTAPGDVARTARARKAQQKPSTPPDDTPQK